MHAPNEQMKQQQQQEHVKYFWVRRIYWGCCWMIYQTVSEMENGKWFEQQQFPKLNAHTCWKGRRVGAVQHTPHIVAPLWAIFMTLSHWRMALSVKQLSCTCHLPLATCCLVCCFLLLTAASSIQSSDSCAAKKRQGTPTKKSNTETL